MRPLGAGEGCEPFANEFNSHISPQMDALQLLKIMASEHSGISEYWRARIQHLLSQVPQEPKNWIYPEPPVAEKD